jgi:hypothetical protein
VLLHETLGLLSANLYEFSVRLNGLGGSNQLVYTAYTLGLWLCREWHLFQHEGHAQLDANKDIQGASKNEHDVGCHCMLCEEMDSQAQSFLCNKVIPYLTHRNYRNMTGEPKLEVGQATHMRAHVSTRQLFEPGYDAWQNEMPFQYADTSKDLFDKHLQITSICLRKEMQYMVEAIETMYLARHRPAFQSLRAVLRDECEVFPVDMTQRSVPHAKQAPKRESACK